MDGMHRKRDRNKIRRVTGRIYKIQSIESEKETKEQNFQNRKTERERADRLTMNKTSKKGEPYFPLRLGNKMNSNGSMRLSAAPSSNPSVWLSTESTSGIA